MNLKNPQSFCSEGLEATIGFEPMIRVLQTRALPLGYVAIFYFYVEATKICYLLQKKF